MAKRFIVENPRDIFTGLRVGVAMQIPWTLYRKEEKSMEQILLLDRKIFTDKSTIGELLDIDRVTKLCFTLEDTCRKKKVYGETAIPSGKYKIVLSNFRESEKQYPMLIDVPLYAGIFIHSGNIANDTHGCVLVGMRMDKDSIYDSKRALNDVVIPKIQSLLSKGDVFLQIMGGYSIEEWEEKHV